MISGLAEVRAALKRGSDRPALERAADAVMKAVRP
jgi:hypothetical protein